MKVTHDQFQAEVDYLQTVLSVIDRQGAFAGKIAQERLREAAEFKKYLWERGRKLVSAKKPKIADPQTSRCAALHPNTNCWPGSRRREKTPSSAAWNSKMSLATPNASTSASCRSRK